MFGKRFLLINLLIAFYFTNSAQDRIKYEIRRNSPELSHNRVQIWGTPATFEFGNHKALCYGFNTTVKLKDRFIISADAHRSYTRKINEKYSQIGRYTYNGYKGVPKNKLNYLMNIEVLGQYILGGYTKEGEIDLIIKQEAGKTHYLKMPLQRYHMFPLRFGMSSFQGVANSVETIWKNPLLFRGYNIDDPNRNVNYVHGHTNYESLMLHFGIGLSIMDDIKIYYDYDDRNGGLLEMQAEYMYYFDFIFPIKQQFEEMLIFNSSSYYQIFDLNKHTRKLKSGFRLGFKKKQFRRNKTGMSIKCEIGARPGFIDLKTSMYAMVGIDVCLYRLKK